MKDEMIISGCSFCTGTLPTIRLGTTQYGADNRRIRMCRACILVALKAVEAPDEYPAIIEDRDADLAIIRGGE